MSVKLVAVDMDGTFLNASKSYNRQRFQQQYQAMRAQGIRFVVASGNQFWQLLSFFPEIAGEMSFVAENGAYVVSEGQEIYCGHIPRGQVLNILNELGPFNDVCTVVCGKQTAWLHQRAPEAVVTLMSRHYHRLQRYQSVDEIGDDIFKIALTLEDTRIPQLKAHLRQALNGDLTPVTSGFGFVDLIIPGIHKAHGLKMLQQRWGIADDEVMAIGDSGNDREMLMQAGYSFSMANASEEIRQVTRYQAGHHNDEAVLDVIDDLLNGVDPFHSSER
ncbi:Cof-type HAD-IIB family hydrolase [Erwiniaceae bacterium BAC15a-03b]|uniref:Cof-type HAD-IIB family hydrolase n=1 Tax=Winslowiella arboricola TaxID=2978220 RepID=A0A9J6PIA4_9GAMM|nr:Cof-type HAD-IIB family hydrolase [Winslowiella arboricola]MCU5774541.1 Cof-type HAD-IIB family hydrolase [Winslowiella arboricola]MCU5778049.1 Cof-type HAD-IIB family hydrolase [Winslowiella arboricola]